MANDEEEDVEDGGLMPAVEVFDYEIGKQRREIEKLQTFPLDSVYGAGKFSREELIQEAQERIARLEQQRDSIEDREQEYREGRSSN